VISSYVREVHRLLRPGGLFKFQVQGSVGDPAGVTPAAAEPDSTETTGQTDTTVLPGGTEGAASPTREQIVRTDELATDTWRGTRFTDAEAARMAEECGFEARYRIGAGTQYFWLWFFRN
jgi:hypothetical protein